MTQTSMMYRMMVMHIYAYMHIDVASQPAGYPAKLGDP